jgi:glycosyltransferase involved in cell wall biosynthesis
MPPQPLSPGAPRARTGSPGLVIALPHGLNVSGITMWAVRLVNALAERGRAAALVLHPEPEGAARIDAPIDPRVRLYRAPGPPIDRCRGALGPYLPTYLAAVRETAAITGEPAVLSPNLHGDCYGIAAAIGLTEPSALRVIGWQHSDIDYDRRVLTHYAPILSAAVAVSRTIESRLLAVSPPAPYPIHRIPYGVEIGPLAARRASGALRILYTGRIEHRQKRILALPHFSRALESRGIDHVLTVAGDGPAAGDLRREATAHMRLLGAQPPAAVRNLLSDHDLLVLPSRFEGLSVSVLEAMAFGCTPVIARTDSGAEEAVEHGISGLIADVAPDADECAAGLALAEAVGSLVSPEGGAGPIAVSTRPRLESMSFAARSRAAERFSLRAHVEKVSSLLDRVAGGPPRSWPAVRPCAFSAPAGAGSGSVPPEGPARLAELLESLAGRDIIIHGGGQHTLQLGAVLAGSPARVAAIADDDRARHGSPLWGWRVIAPEAAGETGATDVVISSWIHQDAIWARRGIYEQQGLRVHRIYM